MSDSNYKKYIIIMWVGALAALLLAAALFVLISKTQMPDTKSLENPEYEYASIVLSHDLQELGRYYKYNREWLDYDEINPYIINALVSTEDERFYKHAGIDVKGTIRAVAFLGRRGGASTITQQLAKLFFTEKSRSFIKRVWQKLEEWVIAVQFEKRYTKQEILSMYLNKFDFLYNSHGVGAASQTYFGKNQSELSLTESAILVGMLKNPSLYNPKKYPTNAIRRRNVVLNQMVRNRHLSSKEYDELKTEEIDNSKFKRDTHYNGPAPYFRSSLTTYLKNLLDDDQYKKPDGTKYNIYQDGLKIYTTIDLGMQQLAERAMVKHMKQLQKRYFKIWKNHDPWSYEANKDQKNIRTENLNKLVRATDRFQNLRSRYLTGISQKINETFSNARLNDADILRIKKAKAEDGYLNQLRAKKIISKSQQTIYQKILKDPLSDQLLTRWSELHKAAKKEFNRKQKMKVFSYNFSGEQDTLMSPLDSIKYHRMHMQMGSVSIEPSSGEVKAWIGGINHKYFKYDHVKSDRQVGSTFKPFVYTTAIFGQGMSPCRKVPDIQYTIPKGDPDFGLIESWSPANADGTFSGNELTLMDGLKYSTNSISVWLMKQLGTVAPVRDLAETMGIDKSKIPPYPSICLGTPELNVLELTSAYGTFANNGVYNKPLFITKIEDNNGKIIYNAIPEQRRALSENYNYVMVKMLKHAASSRASWLKSEFGGKTGTTDDYVDGWFMGISPDLVTGTWVGGSFPWIRFKTLADGQGGVMARPYFLDFMQLLESDPNYNYITQSRFVIPEELIEMDCSKYDQFENSDEFTPPDDLNNEDIPKKIDEFEEEFDQD